jgi:lyso-ornithine lipid O-acyltransferase
MKLSEIPRAVRRLMRLAAAINKAGREAKDLDSAHDRAIWQQRQAVAMLDAMEVEVEVRGIWPHEGLLVGNHLGYLDILVIASQLPCVFVSKSEVRSWPFIGNLLGAAGTILADRDRRHSAHQTMNEIRGVLEQGLPVVVFPEGTSSDGSRVLPFRSSLLEATSGSTWAAHPMAISYRGSGGDPGRDICYWGDATFLPHLTKLARIDPLKATLAIGQREIRGLPRKETATILRDEVVRLLDVMKPPPPSGETSPASCESVL